MTGAKLNKIYTEFVFFKASTDESTVEVVYSFPAGTMGDGAECPGWIPCGAKLDKTRTKFRILKFFLDERRKSPCLKIAAPKPAAPPLAPHSAGLGAGFKTAEAAGRYGSGSIIAPEYKPAAAACRSRGARYSRGLRLEARDWGLEAGLGVLAALRTGSLRRAWQWQRRARSEKRGGDCRG